MTVPDAYRLLHSILAAMPDRAPYPKPHMVVHESATAMVSLFGPRYKHEAETGYQVSMTGMLADPDTCSIHVPYETLALENAESVLRLLLHELGHLFYAKRDGSDSESYNSEAKAWAFSRRWFRKTKGLVA